MDATEDRWVDLQDPDEAELRAALPIHVHDLAWQRLLRPAVADDEYRPRLEAQDGYVFGILAFPSLSESTIVFQEIDLIATPTMLLTVRKTPPGHQAAPLEACRNAALRAGAGPGMSLYELFDEIAEAFLDIIDRFDDKIDELEDHVLDWESKQLRERISHLRHGILRVRRALAPTRDAARNVLDDRVDLAGVELFPRDVELRFADAYDKLLRATDGLDLSRDLLAGVRDFHQSEIANDQNEVTKRLTVFATLLLAPTLIVGWYGQNFIHMPELRWKYGYLFSITLIVLSTVAQIIYYKRKKYL